jgi:hypothetical protein
MEPAQDIQLSELLDQQQAGLLTDIDRSFLIHGDIHTNGHVLDDEILADSEIQNAIDNQDIATKLYKRL